MLYWRGFLIKFIEFFFFFLEKYKNSFTFLVYFDLFGGFIIHLGWGVLIYIYIEVMGKELWFCSDQLSTNILPGDHRGENQRLLMGRVGKGVYKELLDTFAVFRYYPTEPGHIDPTLKRHAIKCWHLKTNALH